MVAPARESDPDQWLEQVYGSASPRAVAAAYDGWAESYDADMLQIGYANPAVAAGLVGRWFPDLDAEILEAGVGTGVLGEILATLGYKAVSGVDISEGMLARAQARDVYRDLRQAVLGETLPYGSGAFAGVVCFGVFTPGHAPCEALDELVRVTRPGGRLVFTVSTAAWIDGGFEAKLSALEAAARLSRLAMTGDYRPMPLSQTESHLTTRAYVYEVL
jgi:predicted TPR repeat methyltransferase